ncbi:hypothetical protein Glove_87g18 [Diversispora epigaea]|uniref:Ion transport domain-containing protein n=1 Tax=Diversispora epigaea TaxID=1348612 RepID=A0A397JD92_9GLOM|nr:hypothetical protein Glove_87g18 [Diversispora epigaea]
MSISDESDESKLSKLNNSLEESDESKLLKFDNSLDESDIESIVGEVLQVDEAKVKIDSLDSLIKYLMKKDVRHDAHLDEICIENVDEFSKQSNYVEVPLELCKKKKFISIREELWGYRFPNYNKKLPSSIFDRFEKIPRHPVTLCYVPLPGLCTYPKDDSSFFSCGLSPFVKLVLSSTPVAEVFQDEHASSKIFESQYFQAIVKYKWHAFARKRFLILLSCYFSFFLLFNVAIYVSAKKDAAIVEYSEEVVNAAINSYTAAMNTTINNIDDMNNVTKAVEIKSDIETIYQTIFYKAFDKATIKRSVVAINDAAITAIKDVTAIDAVVINNTYVEAITAEISRISDTIKITDDAIVKNLMIVCTIMTVISILVNVGIFIIAMIVFAIAHSLLILFSSISTNFDNETKAFEENKFGKYKNSLDNIWTGFLNAGYDGLSSWGTIFPVLLKIAFSFFTAIIIMNLLIAFVNDIYNNINQRKDAEWTTVRAQLVAYIEILCSSPKIDFPGGFLFIDRNNKDYFPSTIIYEASSEKIEKFKEETAGSGRSSIKKIEKFKEETAGSGGSSKDYFPSTIIYEASSEKIEKFKEETAGSGRSSIKKIEKFKEETAGSGGSSKLEDE